MNRGMEQLISRELKIDINQIRKSTWDELLKRPYAKEKAFRPKNMFLVNSNINLAENQTMGTRLLNIRNNCRKALYTIKCLIRRFPITYQ